MNENQPTSALKRFGLSGALLVGGIAAGSLLNPIGVASAQSNDASVTTDSTATDSTATDGTATDNTATDSTDRGPGDCDGDRGGPGEAKMGGRRGHGPDLDELSGFLGLSADEIRQGLADGSTLADLAAQQGIDEQALVDHLVAGIADHIDSEVADGELTQDEADAKLADAEQRVTDMVEGTMPLDGPGRGGPGRGGPGHDDGGADRGGHRHGPDQVDGNGGSDTGATTGSSTGSTMNSSTRETSLRSA